MNDIEFWNKTQMKVCPICHILSIPSNNICLKCGRAWKFKPIRKRPSFGWLFLWALVVFFVAFNLYQLYQLNAG